MPGKIAFVSDIHLSFKTKEKDEVFKKFLEKEGNRFSKIYILGDLFNFGFLFQKGIHPYYREWIEFLSKKKNIVFLPGNHDFWIFPYLKHFGIEVIKNPSKVKIDKKRFLLAHGRVERNPRLSVSMLLLSFPIFVFPYSLLPPKIGTHIAEKIMNFKKSKKKLKKKMKVLIPKGVEFIITGHNHIGFIKKIDDLSIANPGSFRDSKNFLIYEKGILYFRRLE